MRALGLTTIDDQQDLTALRIAHTQRGLQPEVAATIALEPVAAGAASVGGHGLAAEMPAEAASAEPLAAMPLRAVDLVSPAILNLALERRTGTDFPRSEATVPVAPADPPTDDMLFEDAHEPARLWFLPRYELVLLAPDQYAVQIEGRGEAGWALTVALRAVPPPGLSIDGASELPHTASLILTYGQPGGGQRELGFDPPVREALELRASLPMRDLPSRDTVVRALSDPTAAAQLVVRRTFDVAVPIPFPDRSETAGEALVVNERAFARIVGPGPPMLSERFSDRVLVQEPGNPRDREPFPEPTPDLEPVPPPPPPEPRLRQSRFVLDARLETFTFDRETHAYVYEAVTESAPGSGRLRVHRVRYGDRTHRYFQDPSARDLFFCLPDAYRIPRDDGRDHAPVLRVRVSGGTTDPYDVKLLTDYLAVSVIDPDRLRDAAAKLAGKVPEGFGPPQFERFEVRPDRLKYRVRLPRAEGGIGEVLAGDSATLELRSIRHTFELPVREFQSIVDAIHGEVSTLFEGTVELTLDGDPQPELIPVLTSAADFAGALYGLAAAARVNGPAGTDVVLRNVVESPIRLGNVRAVLVAAHGTEREAVVTGADLAAAIDMPSGATLALHVAPPAGDAEATGVVRVLADAVLLPDKEALWNAILDPATPNTYVRTVQVHGEGLFAGEPPVVAVLVEFKGAHNATLRPEAPAAAAAIPVPLSDYVLRRETVGGYEYRCHVVRGTATAVGGWHSDSLDPLYPKVD